MIHFEEQDRKAWLAFLNSEPGRKGLAFLREQKRPGIRKGGAPHEMQFDLGVQDGFTVAIEEVESLGRIPKPPSMITADRPPLESTRRE